MIKKTATIFFCLLFASLVIYYVFPESKLPARIIIDKLVVLKSKRQLLVYANGSLKTYKISLGFTPKGKKQFDGDGKTPEGLYFINDKNPNSVCHKNLGISYPNQQDKLNAKAAGKPVGGDVKIHGLKNGRGFIGKFHRWYDWTDGCVALTDNEIDDLYNHTAVGTPIEIKL